MASVNKNINASRNRVSRKQLLEELNERRESHCLVERSNQVSFLRVQKRHFNQDGQPLDSTHVRASAPESSRASWVERDLSVHKERRHFPPKNNAIFG
ncbi:spermatogenesis-associated protein 45 [Mesocricetus auratus]|uniref:Spermatogenesis-associated protein 45 n=1 Tax=Mesocricetus auratus TaxID=10036 RepID=A0A1U7R7Z5_MESAU|nr:spermatogenesis-associated protein 45 [Mesocricetus auratus]XP_021090252.1 spermatogenesis-associated protein 45 [Mesocricetus auratus]XP_021090253.1 spermatogenesis-associated protein 45 [Mesocricetus auratus]XP_040594163.1 spermatogenesis-associated protein 45 [Mesocricetus auratus]